MYNCQQALINHLCQYNSQAMTIEAYAGQLKDATKLCQILPAILVMYAGGEPVSQNPYHDFDILFITESNILDANKTNSENLILCKSALTYLVANPLFKPLEGPGTYFLRTNDDSGNSTPPLSVRMLMQDNRFTITAFIARISDCT